MFVAPNCECGGGPVLRVVRGEHVFCFTLDFDDKVVLRTDDVVFVECGQCGEPLELREVVEAKAAGKI